MVDSHAYLAEFDVAKRLAHQAGIIMRRYFETDIRESIKGDSTPLTVADTEINALVVNTISETFPHHGIVAEEGSRGTGDEEYEWICDPIDGTIPYTLRFPCSIFSLALYRNKRPLFGLLYDPFQNKLYHAFQGSQAHVNDKPIRVRSGKLQEGDVIGINSFIMKNGFGLDCSGMTKAVNMHQIRTEEIHSICFFACAIAGGFLKAACVPGAYIWDRAASTIVVQAAGGVVSNENGNPVDLYTSPKYMIIAAKDAFPEMLELTRRHVIFTDKRV